MTIHQPFSGKKNQTPPYYGDYNHQILLAAPINFAPSTGLGALAGTQEEVESLKYLFGGQNWVVNTKLNADASEAFVKQMDLTAFPLPTFGNSWRGT